MKSKKILFSSVAVATLLAGASGIVSADEVTSDTLTPQASQDVIEKAIELTEVSTVDTDDHVVTITGDVTGEVNLSATSTNETVEETAGLTSGEEYDTAYQPVFDELTTLKDNASQQSNTSQTLGETSVELPIKITNNAKSYDYSSLYYSSIDKNGLNLLILASQNDQLSPLGLYYLNNSIPTLLGQTLDEGAVRYQFRLNDDNTVTVFSKIADDYGSGTATLYSLPTDGGEAVILDKVEYSYKDVESPFFVKWFDKTEVDYSIFNWYPVFGEQQSSSNNQSGLDNQVNINKQSNSVNQVSNLSLNSVSEKNTYCANTQQLVNKTTTSHKIGQNILPNTGDAAAFASAVMGALSVAGASSVAFSRRRK